MKHSPRVKFYKKPLVASVAAALLSLSASNASAATFELGDFEITFDSTFSAGASWRVENRDTDGLIGKSNNPNNGFNFSNLNFLAPPLQQDIWQGAGSYSTNGDNGNLNFEPGETFSKIVKGSHDIDIRYGDFGFFTRVFYFYDFEIADESRAWANPITGQRSDLCEERYSDEQVCKDFRTLDAFFYGDFDIGEMPLSVRVGEQVISWGESTLIAHGISELNPVDISRLRAPGAELKEAFIPFGAVWASLGVTETFDIEAFYQYGWAKTLIPAAGSYFATNDFAGDGGHLNNIQTGFAGRPDINLDALINGLNQFGNLVRSGALPASAAGRAYLAHPTVVALRPQGRDGEIRPENGGQYGLRLSWYLQSLNDTELSLYHMNYHSRRPVISGRVADYTTEAILNDVSFISQNQINRENVFDLRAFPQVRLEYTEDIKLYGLSFNTTVGTTSVAGEISYRQDEPLQIDDVEILFAAIPQQIANVGINPALNGISQLDTFQPGQFADGFILSDTTQAQVTLTHLFGPTFGATQFTGLIEIGGVRINDFPDPSQLRLNAPGTGRNGGIDIPGGRSFEIAIQNGVETNPFASQSAWGYRVLARLEYNDAFAGINVAPRVVFSHDVNGTTPDPLFLFSEERKSASFGVSFDYQNRWSAEIGYNVFFDGVGTSNQFEDRDFVSLSVTYNI